MATPTVPAPAARPSGSAETHRSDLAPTAAFAGVRRVPPPVNEPNRTYAPGSPDRAALKSRLKEMAGETTGHPDRDRGPRNPDGQDGPGGDAARPPPRARRLSPGRRRARPAGDRRGRGSAPRVGQLAVGRTRRGAAASGRAAGDIMAADAQCGHHARAVEDRVPGGDRRRVRDDRFLAVQHRLRPGALFRAADQHGRRVEPDGVPPARGLRLRRLAVQLHRHRRQPDDRAGADGQHGDLEAGGNGDVERLLHAQAARSRRAAARRHQLPARAIRARSATICSTHPNSRACISPAARKCSTACGARSAKTWAGIAPTRASSARPAARISSSCTRPPIRPKWRWRSPAARSSTRARSVRPQAASTCRAPSGHR